jgi:metal-dependent amidase/aminoacylase/carboxypeptidase family protein
MKGGSAVLSNDAAMATAAAPVLRRLLGEKAVVDDAPRLMVSEDFHHLVLDNEKRRYLYMYVGTARPEHVRKARAEGRLVPYLNHNPDYRVDPDALPIGAKVGTVTVLELLARGASPAP